MVGTWNVRTLYAKGKLENLKREMLKMKLNILGVSEVRWKGKGDFISDGMRVIYSGGEEHQNGVALVLDENAGKRVKRIEQINDRIIVVKLETESVDTVLIQIYMPTTNHTEEEVEQMYEKLEELINKEKGK